MTIASKQTVFNAAFAIGAMGLAFLAGCKGAPLAPPKANVEVTGLTVSVQKLDETPWKGCTFTLNADGGAEAYKYAVEDSEGAYTYTVPTTKFTQADGSRFIPLIKKARNLKIQCKTPVQPLTVRVD